MVVAAAAAADLNQLLAAAAIQEEVAAVAPASPAPKDLPEEEVAPAREKGQNYSLVHIKVTQINNNPW